MYAPPLPWNAMGLRSIISIAMSSGIGSIRPVFNNRKGRITGRGAEQAAGDFLYRSDQCDDPGDGVEAICGFKI